VGPPPRHIRRRGAGILATNAEVEGETSVIGSFIAFLDWRVLAWDPDDHSGQRNAAVVPTTQRATATMGGAPIRVSRMKATTAIPQSMRLETPVNQSGL
jgi:hypothetical protein